MSPTSGPLASLRRRPLTAVLLVAVVAGALVPTAGHGAAADTVGPRVSTVVLTGGVAPEALVDGVATHTGATLTVGFDEPVALTADLLRLAGGRSRPRVSGFALDADGRHASWTLSVPLASDSYLLQLSDRVSDLAGNRLDGDWSAARTSGPSGNGQRGGEMRLRFDLVTGDADQDGTTDASDLAGTLTATDAVRAEVRDHLGDTASPLPPGTSLQTVGLGDADADGVDELATLQESPTPRVRVQSADGVDAQLDLPLSRRYRWLALAPVRPSGASAAARGFAAVALDEGTGIYRVWVWDRSGAARSWTIGRGEAPRDLVAWVADDGSVDVAVLGYTSGTSNARLRVLRTATGTTNVVTVAAGVDARLVGWNPSTTTQGSELVVATRVLATGATRMYRLDPGTLARLASLGTGTGEIDDALSYVEPTSGERRYAVLRHVGATGTFQVRKVTGALTGTVPVPLGGAPAQALAWRDGGVVRLGVLDVDDASGASRVVGADASGQHPFATSFGAGRAGTSLTALRTGGGVALAVSEQNTSVGVQQVQVRSAEGNHRVRTLPLVGSARADDWFLGHRVHGHTRYYPWHPKGLGFYGVDGFERTGADFARLGAHAFTRSTRHFDEAPWWPSEVPLDPNGDQQFLGARTEHGIELTAGRSLAQESVTEAWASGEPMLAYYNDMSEASVAAAHPDWVCRTSTGVPATHETKGTFLDLTGPYGQVVLQRLLELADMGASGAYLDFRHLPLGGCYGSALAVAYTQVHGPPPAPGRTTAYQAFLEFNARRLSETVEGWRAALQREYPSFRVLTSVTSVPALTQLDMDTSLGVAGDTKTEFGIAVARGQSNSVLVNNPSLARPDDDVRMAFGMSLLRDAHRGHGSGIAHVWKGPSPTVGQDRSFVGAVTTFGGIAALDVPEQVLAGGAADGVPGAGEYASVFAQGDRLSPALVGSVPLGDAAVLFSERERDALYPAGDAQMWRRLVLPTLGGYDALTRSGMTPSVLDDEALSAGVPPSVRTLWVPDLPHLTAVQAAAVDAFRAAGGRVLAEDIASGLTWGTQPEYDASVAALRQRIAVDPSPVRVEGLPQRAMAAGYVRGSGADTRLTVMVTNGFAHVQPAGLDTPLPPDQVNAQPAPVPAGSRFVFDLARVGATSADDVVAFDGVTGEPLPVSADGAGQGTVTIPGFAEVAQVTVVHR